MTGAEAQPMSLDAHVAVQTVELRHVRESLDRIEQSLGAHVTRTEWEQRNGYVDGQFQHHTDRSVQLAQRIDEQERKADAARAPWWVVLGAGLGIVSAVVAVMSVLVK